MRAIVRPTLVERIPLQIVEFTSAHVDDAARVMATMYTALRRSDPQLPARLADETSARVAIAEASGVAAIDGGELVGFMLASEPHIRLRHHAVRLDDARRIYRMLYAAAAERLLAAGHLHHLIAMPVDLIGPWIEMEFGIEQVKGVRGVEPLESRRDVTVRRAVPDDLEAIAHLSIELSSFHAAPPMFKIVTGPWADVAHVRELLARDLAKPSTSFWIALDGETITGMMAAEPDKLADTGVLIGIASVTASARSSGVGTAILARVIEWARDNGYERCRAGWTSHNPVSDPFWRSRGFRPLYYTLARRIDPKAAESA